MNISSLIAEIEKVASPDGFLQGEDVTSHTLIVEAGAPLQRVPKTGDGLGRFANTRYQLPGFCEYVLVSSLQIYFCLLAYFLTKAKFIRPDREQVRGRRFTPIDLLVNCQH